MQSMCTPEQLDTLRSLCVEGSGSIVEVGPWLGESTKALAVHGRVYTTDLWVWKPYMGPEPKSGFRATFDANVAGLDVVVFDKFEPQLIKLLFLDCINGHGVAVEMLQRYVPHIKKGGLLIDQDVGWNPVEHFTSLVMYYRLRHKLVRLYRVTDMFVWYVKEMVCESDLIWRNTDTYECEKALKWLNVE